MPSAASPFCNWNCRNAACVSWPKTPSAVRFAPAAIKGPYLVSTTEPASPAAAENKNVRCPCLFQDLSTVEPSIMVLWIQEFKKQAAQEEFWRVNERETAILKLRNAIAVGASALDATKKSAEQWMGLLSSLVSWGEAKKDAH
jgi:hypothetical protein